jgi:hypothetical protein
VVGDRDDDDRRYGDVPVKTGLGLVVGVAVMLVGIGFIALLTGAVAERFLKRDVAGVTAELDEIESVDAEIVAELSLIWQRLDRLEGLMTRRT